MPIIGITGTLSAINAVSVTIKNNCNDLIQVIYTNIDNASKKEIISANNVNTKIMLPSYLILASSRYLSFTISMTSGLSRVFNSTSEIREINPNYANGYTILNIFKVSLSDNNEEEIELN